VTIILRKRKNDKETIIVKRRKYVLVLRPLLSKQTMKVCLYIKGPNFSADKPVTYIV